MPSYTEFHNRPFNPVEFSVPFFRDPTYLSSTLLIPHTCQSTLTEDSFLRTTKRLVYAPNLVMPPSNKSNSDVKSAYRCDFPDCDKTFTRPYNLKSHLRTHTFERPFVCPLCPKSFARQHDRNRHAKLHLGIKPYTCQYCTKSFARHDALNRHQRLVSGIPACVRSFPYNHRKKSTGST